MSFFGYDHFKAVNNFQGKKIRVFKINDEYWRGPVSYNGFYGTLVGVYDNDTLKLENPIYKFANNDDPHYTTEYTGETDRNTGQKFITIRKDDITRIVNDNNIEIYKASRGGKRRNKSRKQRKSKKQRKSRKHNKK